jgi:hypothetical protein
MAAPRMQRVVNFFMAMARLAWAAIRGGPVFVTEEIKDARVSMCEACPYSVQHYNDPAFLQCDVCGCLAHPKAALQTERCPKNLWSR